MLVVQVPYGQIFVLKNGVHETLRDSIICVKSMHSHACRNQSVISAKKEAVLYELNITYSFNKIMEERCQFMSD